MNKILIKCDGNEMVVDTIRTVADIVKLLQLNSHHKLLLINSKLLSDELFKGEFAINPSFVTLVKDITKEVNCLGPTKVVLKIDNEELLKGLANRIARNGGF